MNRLRAAFKRQPRRIKFLIVFLPLFVCGMALNAAQGGPRDNVTHQPGMCQRIVWNVTTGHYVIINYPPPKGGGCK